MTAAARCVAVGSAHATMSEGVSDKIFELGRIVDTGRHESRLYITDLVNEHQMASRPLKQIYFVPYPREWELPSSRDCFASQPSCQARQDPWHTCPTAL